MMSVQRGAAPMRLAFIAATALGLSCSIASRAVAEALAATSDPAVREEACRAIPWRRIAPQHRGPALHVVKNASIYRQLPVRIIDCDPEMFTFLVQHPDVVVDVWRVMGLSQVSLERSSNDTYRGTDGAGTTGTIRYLYADWGQNAYNQAVIYSEGAYKGKPFVTPIKAQSVLLLRSGAVQETNGRHYVTVRIDSFVRIEQLGVELVAKTIQPWISKTADYNYLETLTFVSNFSRTAEQNPEGIQRLAPRLASIDEPTRNALVELSFRTAERYAQRNDPRYAGPALLAQKSESATR